MLKLPSDARAETPVGRYGRMMGWSAPESNAQMDDRLCDYGFNMVLWSLPRTEKCGMQLGHTLGTLVITTDRLVENFPA